MDLIGFIQNFDYRFFMVIILVSVVVMIARYDPKTFGRRGNKPDFDPGAGRPDDRGRD